MKTMGMDCTRLTTAAQGNEGVEVRGQSGVEQYCASKDTLSVEADAFWRPP